VDKQEQKQRLSAVLHILARAPDSTEAWQQLYELAWPFVFAFTYRYLRGARYLAEDASQEVFLRLIKYCNFSKVFDPQIFRAYVAVICINVCHDYLRRIKREAQWSESAPIPYPYSSPEEHAKLQDLLNEAFEQLNETDQKLLSLSIQGYKLPEIVKALGLSYENTAVRLHRLRSKLRKSLKRLQ
jgi:RNA polymerase sigma factor (sigma-70 family)